MNDKKEYCIILDHTECRFYIVPSNSYVKKKDRLTNEQVNTLLWKKSPEDFIRMFGEDHFKYYDSVMDRLYNIQHKFGEHPGIDRHEDGRCSESNW